MPRLPLRPLLAVLMLLASQETGRAAGVLDQLPADATGFVAVHRLSAASAKVERVLAIFQDLTPGPLPAPLALAMGATGMGPGLNQDGNALLALLPSDDAPFPPQPLLLIPVSNYAEFAGGIGGDAAGEICRVTIAGEEVLLAKRGDFAALMNIEHRAQFEKVLAAAPAAPADLAPLADWLATTDIAAGLTRAGVERLTALGRRQAADWRQRAEANADDPFATPELQQIRESMQTYELLFEFLGAEMQAGAVGLSIDESTNVKLAKRIILSKAGAFSPLANAGPIAASPLSRFAAGQYVVAGGGPIPPGFGAAFASLVRRFAQQLPAGQGYEGFAADDWEKLEESYRSSLDGVTAMAFVLYAGAQDEGLFSNYYVVCDVADSNAYLADFRRSLELDNELMAKAENDLEFPFELSDATISGKAAVVGVADVGGAVADPNVPAVESLMKALFGPDGKMHLYAVAADANTTVIGSATQEQLAEAVEFALNGQSSRAVESSVGATTKLLDPAAPWQALINPAGAIAWAMRGAQTWAATFGDDASIPPFPATSPVGLSLNLTNGIVQGELVIPVDLLEGIADYALKLQSK